MNIQIKEMSIADLENIKNILECDFDNFWNYTVFKDELNSINSKYITAFINDEIIGFAGIKISGNEADIMNIVTKKIYRNNGVGKKLLSSIIELCRSNNISTIFLEVNEDNFPAISLYEKFGFSKIGIRKNYYNGKNGISMSKKIFEEF